MKLHRPCLNLGQAYRDQDGVVTVLVAMLLPVLVGMAAIVVDLGEMWQLGRQAQNCADAAALAGTWELNNTAAAQSVATSYLTAQGAAACTAPGTYSFIDRNTDSVSDAMRVNSGRSTALGFARFWGINTGTVQKTAVAGKITPYTFSRMEPFGLQVDPDQPCGSADIRQYTQNSVPLQFGSTYIIKYSAGGPDSSSPGNFQPLALGGTGSSTYRDNVSAGYPGWISSCGTVSTEPGNMVGPTIAGMNQRMTEGFANMGICPGALAGDPVSWSKCPRIINIALVPPLDNGRSTVQVLSFAWFYVLDWERDGNQSAQLRGIFLDVKDRHAPPDEWQGNTPWDPTSAFPFGVKLIE